MTVVNPPIERIERVPFRFLRKIKHRQFLFTNHLHPLFNYYTTKKNIYSHQLHAQQKTLTTNKKKQAEKIKNTAEKIKNSAEKNKKTAGFYADKHPNLQKNREKTI